MWPATHTEITTARPQDVWALWEAVPRWTQWDEGLDEISIDGPFQVGTTGHIKPTGGPTLKFALIEVDPGRAFTDETRLPLCKLRFAHTLTSEPDGRTAVTLTVSFHGLLRPLFQRVIGKDIARELAGQVQRLTQVAEARSAEADASDAGPANATAAPATISA